jgi:dihydrofolate reductase
MKTLYYTATSLDGFLATEDDAIDWLFPLGEGVDTGYDGFIAGVGALAMGAATYEWILRHGEEAAHAGGSAWTYAQPTWVFAHRRLPPVPGADLRFVQGDVRPVHAEMVRAAGPLQRWVVGGGDLAARFFDAGLLDEAVVHVASVTLGRGKPLFPRRVTSPPWTLLSVRQIGAGLAELHYRLPR